MEFVPETRFLLVVILAVCAVIAMAAVIVSAAVLMKKQDKPRSAPAEPEPLPGGGGAYTMHISGMNCEHCRSSAEAALNAFEGVQARVDLKTETAYIKYSGYPDLAFLDSLREAVENAGFTVTDIR